MIAPINVAHVHLESRLVISDEHVQVLTIENSNEFYNMVRDLDTQFEGGEGTFVFSRCGEIISASKFGAFIPDVFHFDVNDKKTVSLLYKKLETSAFGENVVLFNELNAKVVTFLEELAFTVPFSLDYEQPQPIDYFKMAGVKFAKTYESLEEKIICYINALIDLKKCEFFIFVNLKSVLNDEKIMHIYNHCRAEKVGLFLIESSSRRQLLKQEKSVIITEDLCEIS